MKNLIEFSLYSEGSNDKPSWGIAFTHPNDDVNKIVDFDNKPISINIQFFESKIYSFEIRNSFWSTCKEFVDTKVNHDTPIENLFVNQLGFDITTKGKCKILAEVIEKNKFIKIINISYK